jgi:hypothetical protein
MPPILTAVTALGPALAAGCTRQPTAPGTTQATDRSGADVGFTRESMAERNRAQARQARDELRRMAGFSPADELVKLDCLAAEKSISREVYARLRARIVE